jgi:hypothetical protein
MPERERRNDLEEALAVAPSAVCSSVPTSSWEFQPFSLDLCAAAGASLQKLTTEIAEGALL